MTSRKDCFNPRAHVGRDVDISNLLRTGRCFNPRAHVGRDQSVLFLVGSGLVSIHAPTWGATQLSLRNGCLMSFNPRAHVGRDKDGYPDYDQFVFQSTRPRGARPKSLSTTVTNK